MQKNYSKELGCPVVETVSTESEGLKAVIDAVISSNGKKQKAPYTEGNIDLKDKHVVEEADRKRLNMSISLQQKLNKESVDKGKKRK